MSADFSHIDLAAAEPFALGALDVRPATREVSNQGAREVLQPRIMQVLIALARRRGEVVSRDDLVRTCWDGQAVGDDAINRCIAKLRQLGDANRAFKIVTIARVGYRLEAASSEAGRSTTPVLIVLPFENLSSDPEMQFFSDGVSEEILSAVARIDGLRVIGSASSFSFRDRRSEAARALGATHVIDGAVRRDGARVRIGAQLTEAASGQILWSERYERELAGVFALQDEIAALTATALSARLMLGAPKPGVEPQAYDLYLRALSVRRKLEPSAQEQAIAYLRGALAIEPDFAPARAALAFTLCHRIVAATAIGAPPDAFDAAVADVRNEAERALARDPRNAEANVALLSLEPTIRNWAKLEDAANAGLRAAPSDALLMAHRARLLFGVGRTREAQKLFTAAFANDPLSPRAMAYEAVRRLIASDQPEGARPLADRAFALAPTDPIVWRLRQAVASLQGEWREALALLDTGVGAGQTAERMMHARRGISHRLAGGGNYNHPMLEHGPLLARKSPFIVAAIVFGMIVTSDAYDAALDLVEDAIVRHPPHKVWSQWNVEALNVGPTVPYFMRPCADFRTHPRFLPLCAKLGLCNYWIESGHWPDFILDVPNRSALEAQVRALAG